MEHAVACFARLVQILLGTGSVADGKIESGVKLCILGVELELASNGFRGRPGREKIKKWCSRIDAALSSGLLAPGDAAKLAGRLSWGCSQLFRRFGRALLRPLFDQCSRRDGKVDVELRRALGWWRAILETDLAEVREWRHDARPPCQLFCDASGSPPHLGAVAFVDGAVWWTHMAVPSEMIRHFKARRDNQIMGLELLAISLGMCSFARGRAVVVHCDNTGSEVRQGARLYRFGRVPRTGSRSTRDGEVLGPRSVGA